VSVRDVVGRVDNQTLWLVARAIAILATLGNAAPTRVFADVVVGVDRNARITCVGDVVVAR
jgi:hypothetical protein